MSDKFQLLMNSIDDDLLEEAMKPVKRRNPLPWIGTAIAACLLLVLGFTMFPGRTSDVTAAQLAEIGYEMKLPEQAERICYEIVSLAERKAAQASFVIQGTKYVYQAVKTQEQEQLSDNQNQVLSWSAGDLDIQLLSSPTTTSVSWYLEDEETQCYLTANANTLKVLTTASQILRATGLDVTVAPKNAENITYNAFLLDELTVAETTFQIDGITYAYRMAATMELLENFADISGLDGSFKQIAAGEVFWCRAKLSYNDGGQGKILWFDLVPGILYSMSMDSGASEEALLEMANSLFEPAQDNN